MQPNLTHIRKKNPAVCGCVWNLGDSQIKHSKPQAKSSAYIGGLMCEAVHLTGVDPNTFGLAEPLKEKNNIKTNVAH